MNIYVTIFLTSFVAAITTAIAWLILRRITSSTKGAWSLAIGIGYAVGHVSYLASSGIGADVPLATAATNCLMQIPGHCKAVIWPTEVLNWLPIGVLLAGLVSANSAAFPFDRSITVFGAALVSFWLGLQLIGGLSQRWKEIGLTLDTECELRLERSQCCFAGCRCRIRFKASPEKSGSAVCGSFRLALSACLRSLATAISLYWVRFCLARWRADWASVC